MAKQSNKPKLAYIEWVDSMGQGGWRNYDPSDTLDCTTVGHVIAETKDRVALAPTRCHTRGSAEWNDIIEIPKVAIKRRRRLQAPRR